MMIRKRKKRWSQVTAVVVLGLAMTLLAPSPAFAWGTFNGCDKSDTFHMTNDWGNYIGHMTRLRERVCIKGHLVFFGSNPHFYKTLRGATHPRITFPSKGGPVGALAETLQLSTAPHLVKVYRYGAARQHRVHKLRYNFVVKQCHARLPVCQHLEYAIYVSASFTRLCSTFTGSVRCDRRKFW